MIPLREVLRIATARLAHLPEGRRDAELLLLHALGRDRTWLLTHPDAQLSPEQLGPFDSWIERRARHEPVQYILGRQEFFGLPFRVTPDVLIPRPETEHLIESLLEQVDRDQPLRIVDVGTGSGAIAVALAHALPQASVTALDLSPAALAVARDNAEALGAAVRFLESDLLEAVRGEQFDVVVSNPPYIAELEVLEPQVQNFEPASALFAGPTGLEIYQRLIPQAQEVLIPGGWLLVEMGYGQHTALADLLADWDGVRFAADLQGIARVAIARRRA